MQCGACKRVRYEVLATRGPNHPTEARTETPTITIRDTVRNTEEHRPGQRRNHRPNHRPAPYHHPTTPTPHQPPHQPPRHPSRTTQRNRPNETAPLGHQWSGHPGHLRNRGQDTITTGTPRHRRNTKMKIDWEPTPQSQIFRKLCSGHRGTARTPPEHTTGTPPGHHRPRTIADFPKTGASTNVNRVRSRPQTWWLLGNKIRHVMLSWRTADRK